MKKPKIAQFTLIVERLWIASAHEFSVPVVIDIFPILQSDEMVSVTFKA